MLIEFQFHIGMINPKKSIEKYFDYDENFNSTLV